MIEDYWQKANERHAEEVASGKHDAECEWTEQFRLCHCSKRKREAEGFTTPPTEDLEFPPPDCPRCDRGLDHDGDSWRCYPCNLSWDTSGEGSSAEFTDDHGDLSRCEEHGRRACWHCEEAQRRAGSAAK